MPLLRGGWRYLSFVFLLTLLFANAAYMQQLQGVNSVNEGNGLLANPDERKLISAQQQHDRSSEENGVSAFVVVINSILMAMANCLGAVPFMFVKHLSKDVIGMANAVACGVMLACSFDLLHEGEEYGPVLLVVGLLIGMCCVKWMQSYLERYETLKFEALEGADARKTLLVVGIMAAHAVGEGAGVGVSYSGNGGWSQGLLVTLAIGLHNVPEGLAISTVLISRGVPLRRAVLWNFVAAIPQAIFALPAYLFVEVFTNCLPLALGFAAGCMLWVAFSELLPDAYDNTQSSTVATTVTLSAVCLEAARMTMNTMEEGILLDLRLDTATFHCVSLVSMCFFVCISFALLTKRLMPAMPFNVGIGIGVQFVLGLTLLLRVFSWSPLPSFSCFLWVGFGCVLATLDSRMIPSKTSKVKWNSSTKQNDHLPLIHRWARSHSLFPMHFLNDPIATRVFCSLLGFGVAEGIDTGTSFQLPGYDWNHVLLRTVVRTILFGAMLGLWSLQFRRQKATSIILCGAVSLVPAITAVLVVILKAKLTNALAQSIAVISGFVLSNICRAVFSKWTSSFHQGKGAWQTSGVKAVIPQSEGFITLDDCDQYEAASHSKPHLYHSLGILCGIGVASSVLLALQGLSNMA